MAQDRWINATVDGNAASRASRDDHNHTMTLGAAAANDATFSFDSAKVTSINVLNSLFDRFRERARSLGIK
jgi:hypothetical protein